MRTFHISGPVVGVVLVAVAFGATVHAAEDSFYDGVFDASNLDGMNGFVIHGIDADDWSGRSVSAAGDVNGDGIDDVIIGAYYADPGGTGGAGESYVVFGSDGGFGATMNLSALDGTNGFVINGIDGYDYSGRSVSAAGDVNGDGIGDVIIGAYGADPSGNSSAGESYVVFGSSGGFAASVNLSALDGSNGFVINGIDADDDSGLSVSAAGDVNGDGIDDVIIGAQNADPHSNSRAGESYVVFGSAGGLGATVNLSALDGSNGFVINGIDANDYSGGSVSAAGDVNGDGIDDVIIGADAADPHGNNAAGESYVVFGSSGGFGASVDLSALNGSNGFVINGIDAGDFSGGSVGAAGDVNGDGIDDVIIGAENADPHGSSSAGESYVVFGSSSGAGGTMDLSALNGGNGFVINGIDVEDCSGRSVSAAGDVNGDGVDDVIIGAYYADPNGKTGAGESYVVFGSSSGSAATMNLSALTGSNGFVINGIDALDQSGASVSAAGDVNGDGVDDLIVGAYTADPNGNSAAGESYVVFGIAGFTWTPLGGGNFDMYSNWLGGVNPMTRGVVIIRPDYGGTISGPTSTVIVDKLTLGAEAGVGVLDLPSTGLLVVRDWAKIQSSGKLTGDGTLAVEGALTNAGEIDLGTNSLQVIAGSLTNTGLLRGVGMVDAPVTNEGDIEAFDQTGELVFTQEVTNEATGMIAVRSSALRFKGGLTNSGQISAASGDADLFGDVSNTGTIGIGGSAEVSLVGDLVQNGTLNILSGARLVVYDDFSGTGGCTGGGTLEVLGTLSIGSSPAVVTFDGNVALGGGCETIMELGGTGAGEYDAMKVSGELSLGGDLRVVLIDGFTPDMGDIFTLFDVASLGGTLTGEFSSLELPEGIDWDTGDLYSTGTLSVVPEPGTLALLAVGGLALLRRRRRS